MSPELEMTGQRETRSPVTLSSHWVNPTVKLFGYANLSGPFIAQASVSFGTILTPGNRKPLINSQAGEALTWVSGQDMRWGQPAPESRSLPSLSPSCLQSHTGRVASFYFQSLQFFPPYPLGQSN